MLKQIKDQEEYNTAKFNELVTIFCNCCKKEFKKSKSAIYLSERENCDICCSKQCFKNNRMTGKNLLCHNCSKPIYVQLAYLRKHNFCSQSCAAIYNNQHKTTGTRRSKLEVWLENELKILYPKLEIHYNKSSAINGELDIYIPSIKLAFELNGIFHYEPIFGKEALDKIQNNDCRKFQACLERNIELVVIDTSYLKYFKLNEEHYNILDIIVNIIESKQ